MEKLNWLIYINFRFATRLYYGAAIKVAVPLQVEDIAYNDYFQINSQIESSK